MKYIKVFYCLLLTVMVTLFGELAKFVVSHNRKLLSRHTLVDVLSGGSYHDQELKGDAGEQIYTARQWKGNDSYLYAWSAIYDDRILDGRTQVPHVVVIGLIQRGKPYPLCKLWYSTSHYELVTASIISSGRAFVVHCPCNRPRRPIHVCLGKGCEWQIAVETPQKQVKKKKLAICLKEVYDDPKQTVDPIQAHFLVEWIELNKLLGVDHIIVYNVSMNKQASRVFRHYAHHGFVTVLNRPPAKFEGGKPNRKIGINDCMFRYMHFFEKFINIDCDEFVGGYKYDTVWELLQEQAVKWNSGLDRMLFTFRNQRYFVDDINVTPGPLVTQYAVRHVEAEIFRSKQIVDSAICSSVTPHSCKPYINNTHFYTHVVLEPTEAVSFHYKSCEKSRIANKPSNCSKEFQNSKVNLTMRKYGGMLSVRVEKAMQFIFN